jgi:hypothetical protein
MVGRQVKRVIVNTVPYRAVPMPVVSAFIDGKPAVSIITVPLAGVSVIAGVEVLLPS